MLRSRVWGAIVVPAMLAWGVGAVAWQEAADGALGRGARTFASACAPCHGQGAAGGDRGPTLVNNRRLRAMSHADVEGIIRRGTPNGMPPSALPPAVLGDLTRYIRSLNVSAYDMQPAGDVVSGERFFFGAGACATCHMISGRGASFGPDLSAIGRQLTLSELTTALTNPEAAIAPGFGMVRVRRRDGTIVEGFVRNEGNQTLPVQTVDGRLYSLEKGSYTRLPVERPSLMPALQATGDERRGSHRLPESPRWARGRACRAVRGRSACVHSHPAPDTGRLAELPRDARRQPLQRARPDQLDERRELDTAVDLRDEGLQPRSHAARDGRRDVCDGSQSAVGPRCSIRPGALAFLAASHARPPG